MEFDFEFGPAQEYYIGLDFETQGLDPSKDLPTEIGVVAFDKNFNILYEISSLFNNPGHRPQSAEIIRKTGITNEMMLATGKREEVIMAEVYQRLKGAKAIFAHNKGFDKGFLDALLKRTGMPALSNQFICSMRDIEYPKDLTCMKLSHLAYEHGIMVDPRTLHRASDDVRLMIRLISKYDLATIIENASHPEIKVRILIPPPWEDAKGNEFAKSRGFRFDPATKFWVKTMRLNRYAEETKDSKYPFVKLDN